MGRDVRTYPWTPNYVQQDTTTQECDLSGLVDFALKRGLYIYKMRQLRLSIIVYNISYIPSDL